MTSGMPKGGWPIRVVQKWAHLFLQALEPLDVLSLLLLHGSLVGQLQLGIGHLPFLYLAPYLRCGLLRSVREQEPNMDKYQTLETDGENIRREVS